MARAQQEIPGAERPTIAALDEYCALHLKAAANAKRAKEKAEQAKASVKEAMIEHRENLEADADGNAVYPYVDGDVEKVFRLRRDITLSVVNAKKPTLEEIDVDDEADEVIG